MRHNPNVQYILNYRADSRDELPYWPANGSASSDGAAAAAGTKLALASGTP